MCNWYSPHSKSLHGICGCPLESPCTATEEWDEFVDNYGHLERTLHEAQTARWYVAPPHYHHAESPDETWEVIQMLLGMVVINWKRYVEYLRPMNGLALPSKGCQASMKEWQLAVHNDLRNMSGVAAGKIAPEEMTCSQDVKILAAELLRFQTRLKIRSEETPAPKAPTEQIVSGKCMKSTPTKDSGTSLTVGFRHLDLNILHTFLITSLRTHPIIQDTKNDFKGFANSSLNNGVDDDEVEQPLSHFHSRSLSRTLSLARHSCSAALPDM